jgi:DNA modification methylase
LSDPPYYTACPNPFWNDVIGQKISALPEDNSYHREPFVSDVSEGKYDPLYKLHPYHTKVPHRAIMHYILHYTNPGDIVLDSFAGTGATGLAANLCGDETAVRSLGYKILPDGIVARKESREGFSKIGQRRSLLADLSPAAAFISNAYNSPVKLENFYDDAKKAIHEAERAYGWVYKTLHHPSEDKIDSALSEISNNESPDLDHICPTGVIKSVIWSDVFLCPQCQGEIVFWEHGVDIEGGKVKAKFNCPTCGSEAKKASLERKWSEVFDPYLQKTIRQAVQVPVRISYTYAGSRFQKVPDKVDIAIALKAEATVSDYWCPHYALPAGHNTRQPIESHGFTHVHHFYSGRNRLALSAFNALCNRPEIKSLLTIVALRITKRYGLTYQSGVWGAGGGPTNGTLYIPSLVKELNILEMLSGAISKFDAKSNHHGRSSFISTQSAQVLNLPDDSIDYAFIDPPFGANIMYSQMNSLWEGWLGVRTNTKTETIECKEQGKDLNDYRGLMTQALRHVYRVLKPGRWLTVEFSNTQASVWNAIQISIQEAGFVVANVAALDKQKGSFKAQTTTTAVKQDLIISAYKPDAGLEKMLEAQGSIEASVWDFVQAHLRQLPVVRYSGNELEFLVERDSRILFDRTVAWFVRHEILVPLSSQEFQDGLRSRFSERDGMVFLPDQIPEYERKRAQASQPPQMEMFVADERSAIDWLTDFLRKRPSTYQEVHPEFTAQLGAGWKKHETRPELSALLEDNFLRYDGSVDVPSQVHTYLSSNFHDLRNLEKSDLRLKAKAKDRWYVPDPNKAQDLEKKREKALLKEFEEYRNAPGRKLKEFRLEVLRAGFKAAWASKDYQTIVSIANKVPEDALQEDEKLLFWYDSALTRTGAEPSFKK